MSPLAMVLALLGAAVVIPEVAAGQFPRLLKRALAESLR